MVSQPIDLGQLVVSSGSIVLILVELGCDNENTLVRSSTKCFAAALPSNSTPSRAYGCFVSDESYLANYGILTVEQKY